MSTRTLTTDIPVDLADKVEQMASALSQPADWIVKQALADWIYREEHECRLVLEGLADIDAGRVIEHEAVKAWADSLGTDRPLPVPSPR